MYIPRDIQYCAEVYIDPQHKCGMYPWSVRK